MQVRYYEKNGKTWADFRINDVRKRMTTGVTWGNQKAAELAMPGVIARAMKEMEEAANAPAGKKDTIKVEKKPSSG
ncbi:MAG: hypothetical protein HYX47_00060 [Burkholderiales bacterium]|nr:hypothetical protein [Burkholderiales bacterium]